MGDEGNLHGMVPYSFCSRCASKDQGTRPASDTG